ncbi:DUF3237 domain-containing protein [Pseudonocardia spinosispora]|uniref:DUF3237 domain-containing protein n=1 Tax=Pseudonocardia spinosispora TaxID=103441 RepID=UPI000406A262|nr:DUF3237 domain-containing protein [Pseudonocardia spinosispora]
MDPRIKAVAEIKTVPLFDVVVDLAAPLDFGEGAFGRRILFGATGGSFEGPRLHGTVVAGGGGDWALFRSDGAMLLDVRLTLRTHDDALVHMTYGGRWLTPPRTGGEPTGPDDYFRTNPLFETGSPQYAWLNDIVCVGSGYLVDGGVAYHVSQVL